MHFISSTSFLSAFLRTFYNPRLLEGDYQNPVVAPVVPKYLVLVAKHTLRFCILNVVFTFIVH